MQALAGATSDGRTAPTAAQQGAAPNSLQLRSFLATLSAGESFHRLPSQTIFYEGMGKPVPAGVSDKGWVWMRFRATDEATASLVDGQEAYDAQQLATYRPLRHRMGSQRQVQCCSGNSQHWSAGGRFPMWLGHMIVDRQNQLIYIHVGED